MATALSLTVFSTSGALAAQLPEVTTGPAIEVEATSAVPTGTVNPAGLPLSACFLEYGKATAYDQTAPCVPTAGEIGSGTSPVFVGAELEGLDLGAEYHFRLVAENANGRTDGADEHFKLKGPPVMVGEWTVSAIVSEATIGASINPEGLATTYHVEYGTTEAYGQSTSESAAIGSDRVAHVVTSPLKGLSADTNYHWRVVATNTAGTSLGPDRTFTTYAAPPEQIDTCPNAVYRIGAGALLPDCRAYEMVTPVEKEGEDFSVPVFGQGSGKSRNQSAVSGDKLTYTSQHSFGDALSRPKTVQYIATRNVGEGWSSHAITPPWGVPTGTGFEVKGSGSDNEVKGFSADLCNAWLVKYPSTAAALSPLAVGGTFNLYRRSNCGAEGYEWQGAGRIGITGQASEVQALAGDGRSAAFRTRQNLSQEAASPAGLQLECRTPAKEDPANALSYRWLRDGVEIGGQTNASYTTTAVDAGAAVQCQVRASGGGAGSAQDANPAVVVAPYPASAPPLAPRQIPAPIASAALEVGGPGGQTLSCDPEAAQWGSPAGDPVSFSYRWYRNGVALSGASEAQYTVQGADLGSPAAFQCEVAGQNASGVAVAKLSESTASAPAPGEPAAPAIAAFMERSPLVYAATERGTLRPACVLPTGVLNSGECFAGSGTTSQVDFGYLAWSAHALSEDGRRLYWTAKAGQGAIYLRENPGEAQSALDGSGQCTEAAKACTVAVSEANGFFWGAAADGSRAIYRGGDPDATGTLYAFEAASGESREIAPGVSGVLGMSEDARRVYFASTQECSSGPNPRGDLPTPGKPNLYLYEAGQSCAAKDLAFVGTLSDSDAIQNPSTYAGLTPLRYRPLFHAARVSADGETAVFVSTARLTGYDNRDTASGEADAEVFRYEAASGALDCVSCNPSGARPRGRFVEHNVVPKNGSSTWVAAQIPGAQHPLYFARALSADGSRLFFESFDALSLRDTNGKEDVYQWEAAGTGGCTAKGASYSPPNGGCLSLISSGESPLDSEFFDASPSGRDVFIRTGESLVGRDPGGFDVYDARVGGGMPEPPLVAPCEGDACQSPASAPAGLTPASSTFQGPGNKREGGGSRCRSNAVAARRLARRARDLRQRAAHAKRRSKARQARRGAVRLTHRARRLSNAAKRCRRRAR